MYAASTAGGKNDDAEEMAVPELGDEEYDIPASKQLKRHDNTEL